MKELADWMEIREQELKQQASKPHLLADCLYQADCQFYSYHKCDVSNPIPVICIGSNFGTGPENMLASCGTCLAQWRSNYLRMSARFESPEHRNDWSSHNWSSENFPILPESDQAFFVMTNLCPWITKKDWAKIAESKAKLLLESCGNFAHVLDLIAKAQSLAGSVLVIGHGINDNIRDPLLGFLRDRVKSEWLMFANLTFPQPAPHWSETNGRFMFRKQKV